MFYWIIVILAFSVSVDPPAWGQRWPGWHPPAGPRPEFVSAVKDQARKRMEDQHERTNVDIFWWLRPR